MRICIFTQPLDVNYGGLIQAFALQAVLKRMGHEVWTEDRKRNQPDFSVKLKRLILRILALCPFQKSYRKTYEPNKEQTQYIRKNTSAFIHKYLNLTCPVLTRDKRDLVPYQFEGYVVGSDQVWRPMYSDGIENYFFDFTEGQSVKRVAYAASFGTSKWEFSSKQTADCARLIQNFDAVSVRESSGINLCEQYLKTKAVQVLDPTMLIEREDYERMIADENEGLSEGDLFCYILDGGTEKQNFIKHVETTCNLKSFGVMPNRNFCNKKFYTHLDDYVYPSVTKWLKSFMDAKMVVTDSFHGCVFSIIFNKPFWVIENRSRGTARFTSLLSMFGLNDRIVVDRDFSKLNLYEPIDWDNVNKIRQEWKKKSLDFLESSLKVH